MNTEHYKKSLPYIILYIILLLLIWINLCNKLRFDLSNSKSCKKVLHSIECSIMRNKFYRFNKKYYDIIVNLKFLLYLFIIITIINTLIIINNDDYNIYNILIIITLFIILIFIFFTS